MAAVSLSVSFGLALIACPRLVDALAKRGWSQPNYRGRRVAHPAGLALVLVALATIVVLALIEALTGVGALRAISPGVVVFVLGVAALGLVDDLLGERRSSAPRGLRGHAFAVMRGEPSTGAVKAVGTAALAVAFFAHRGLEPAELALGASVLTLAVHVFNLLDLRPGRSIKALLALVVALTLGSLSVAPVGVLGVFLGPIAALLVFDLREHAMLGDTGAGAVGAVAGLWLVLALPVSGQALALLGLAAIAVYGELRSISALVHRNPLLSRIDSLGRSHA